MIKKAETIHFKGASPHAEIENINRHHAPAFCHPGAGVCFSGFGNRNLDDRTDQLVLF